MQRAITAPLRPNFGRSWYWPRSRSMYRRLGQQPMRCVGGSRAARIVTAERCRRRNACGERTTRVGSESRPTARRLAALPFRPTLGAPGRCSRFRWDSQSLSHFLARESPLRFQPTSRPLQYRTKPGIDTEEHALRIVLVSGDDRRNHTPMISKKHRLGTARLDVRGQGGNLRYFNGFHRSILSFPIHNSLCRLSPTAATMTRGSGCSSTA